MRLLIGLSLFVTLSIGLMASAVPKKEYLTQDELDIIREAQELSARVPAYLNLAERRLIVLGLTKKSEKELEKERKDQERYEKEVKKAGAKKSSTVKPPTDDLGYLNKFSRSDLLRGYIQALDEVMDNIDGAYSSKLDVRVPLEKLEKFTRETAPILQKFEPKNAAEKSALQDAIDKAKSTNDDAKDALKKVPRNERKPPADRSSQGD